jgi:hypothetical protein
LLATIKDSFFFAITKILHAKKLNSNNPVLNPLVRHIIEHRYYKKAPGFATKKTLKYKIYAVFEPIAGKCLGKFDL